MEKVIAHSKYAKLSPHKCRLIVSQIQGLPVDRALGLLKFSLKKGAQIVKKTLESAIANAEHNKGLDIDELVVFSAYVNEGPRYKRMQARAKGRGTRILKPTCHVTVVVSATGGGC